MQEALEKSVSHQLLHLAVELRRLDKELKSKPSLDATSDGTALREFRHALDNVRLTAWTVNELLDARQSQKNPQAAVSFLTVQRLRRFTQMVRDLCTDFDNDGGAWSVDAVKDLTDSLDRLSERLRITD
jgi:hypothetical protein